MKKSPALRLSISVQKARQSSAERFSRSMSHRSSRLSGNNLRHSSASVLANSRHSGNDSETSSDFNTSYREDRIASAVEARNTGRGSVLDALGLWDVYNSNDALKSDEDPSVLNDGLFMQACSRVFGSALIEGDEEQLSTLNSLPVQLRLSMLLKMFQEACKSRPECERRMDSEADVQVTKLRYLEFCRRIELDVMPASLYAENGDPSVIFYRAEPLREVPTAAPSRGTTHLEHIRTLHSNSGMQASREGKPRQSLWRQAVDEALGREIGMRRPRKSVLTQAGPTDARCPPGHAHQTISLKLMADTGEQVESLFRAAPAAPRRPAAETARRERPKGPRLERHAVWKRLEKQIVPQSLLRWDQRIDEHLGAEPGKRGWQKKFELLSVVAEELAAGRFEAGSPGYDTLATVVHIQRESATMKDAPDFAVYRFKRIIHEHAVDAEMERYASRHQVGAKGDEYTRSLVMRLVAKMPPLAEVRRELAENRLLTKAAHAVQGRPWKQYPREGRRPLRPTRSCSVFLGTERL